MPITERFCLVCDNKVIEDPIHFIFECPTYELPRYLFLKTANIDQMYETFNYCLMKLTELQVLYVIVIFFLNRSQITF